MFLGGEPDMLKIYFGDMEDAIYNTSMYFDNSYLDSWLEDDMTKKIIKSVDKADVIGTKAIESKALGVIPIKQLSGGTKTLILIQHQPSRIFNASTCGDNCAPWILKIAKKSKADITINLHHLMNFGDGNFEIEVLNSGDVVRNMAELTLAAGRYL